MSDLNALVSELSSTLTSEPSETEPRPVLRRWGAVSTVNSDGTYDVALSASGVVLPAVRAQVGAYVVGEIVTVEFAHTDPLIAGRAEDHWHNVGGADEPAFANGWGAFDARVPAFRKVTGVVYLAGLTSGGVLGQPAFVLPAGYRPSLKRDFAVLSNTAFGWVYVTAAGGVVPNPPSSNAWVVLDSVRFVAEQ